MGAVVSTCLRRDMPEVDRGAAGVQRILGADDEGIRSGRVDEIDEIDEIAARAHLGRRSSRRSERCSERRSERLTQLEGRRCACIPSGGGGVPIRFRIGHLAPPLA